MVRFIVLSLLLASCAVTSEDAPKMGQEVEPPYGWKYTYCPHPIKMRLDVKTFSI